jgi:ornithine cyclodeaminase
MSDPLALDAEATAAALPYPQLAATIEALLRDDSVHIPPRLVQPLGSSGSLFLMPAADRTIAVVKLITFIGDNPGRGLPAIQGDVLVFDARTGVRRAILDGPTVTARRTAAVSLLAARLLAPDVHGPMLIVGAGVQGRAHLEAFALGLGVREFWIASRSAASAQQLVQHALAQGWQARQVKDLEAAVRAAPLIATCTTAQTVAVRTCPQPDAFITAVGAYTPAMLEWAPEVVRHLAAHGCIVIDTREADHEAGDLLQAGLDVRTMPTLADIVRASPAARSASPRPGPVFFKSCGWAGWDLAAARCALAI